MSSDFDKAVKFVQSGDKSVPVDNATKLEFYKLYKQATVGDNAQPQPGVMDVAGRAKWAAWDSARGMPSEQAKLAYVKLLDSKTPNWRA